MTETTTNSPLAPPVFEDFEGTIARAALGFQEAGAKIKAKQLGLCLSPYKLTDRAHLGELPADGAVRDLAGQVIVKHDPNAWHGSDMGDMGPGDIVLPVLVLWPTGWRPEETR